MENASHALYMVFAFMVFVIACSYSLYLIGIVNSTAQTLVYKLDSTNYYDSLELTNLLDDDISDKAYKNVTIDSIIPTLYRYYKESFCVKIVDADGNLLQIFDTTIEGDVATATKALNKTDYQKAILDLYGDDGSSCYLFGSPWTGDTEFAKERIDLYVSGKAGYINNVYVDYTSTGLSRYSDYTFKEIFTQYSYSGDTITTYNEWGEVEESLTGTSETQTKIVITYQIIN